MKSAVIKSAAGKINTTSRLATARRTKFMVHFLLQSYLRRKRNLYDLNGPPAPATSLPRANVA
jgi:hypothetical protein